MKASERVTHESTESRRRWRRSRSTILYGDATPAAYHELARHHYRDVQPATFCIVRAAWYVEAGGRRRLIGVAVLSWPVGSLTARIRHLGLGSLDFGGRLRFANASVRTISRVIVHPQFRALGIGRRLVADLVERCPTRYVEASAVMGEFARVFAAAGLQQINTRPGEPAYFILDRFTSKGGRQ